MIENNTQSTDDISLKELIINLKEWWTFIIIKWQIIVLFVLIGGLTGFFYATMQKPNYTAKVTFVLEEGKGTSNGLGGLASLAGQFGVDVGSSSGGGLLSGDNILLYFKSPSLAKEVLLTSFDSSNTISIADEYAKVYGLSKVWEDNEKIGAVNFPVYTSKVNYTRLQDSLLQQIILTINSTQFTVARADKKAGFIDVSTKMQSELLSKVYCERIVQKVVDRYISIKTQRQNATVQKLQQRVDSIANLLKQKTFAGATLQNSSNTMDINPIFRTGSAVAIETTLRDKTLLSTIFASVTQNLEIAKFTLSQETPVIQIIDNPFLPLKMEKISPMKASLLGAFLFSLIIIVSLIIQKIYIKIMSE